jgi:NAD(P)-dependent dehydrogenase (short-subunit alcohol dehydrogenase family)
VKDIDGKVALVTGGAGGIGLGIARALASAGARVVIADVRADALNAAASTLKEQGLDVLQIVLDVADRSAWGAAANRIEAELGTVQILCSNAGVNFAGPAHTATYEDWDFAFSVNVGGAVSAVKTFAPRMLARGLEGHIVITSSVSGLFTGGFAGVYVTTKYALVGFAECLRADLAPSGIGVSVLCPGPVKSELFESTVAVRPAALAATGSVPIVEPGIDREHTPIFVTAPTGDEIAGHVLRGIRGNELYIMTHPEIRPVLEARARALVAALPDEPVDPRRIEASAPLLDTSLYTPKKTSGA